ncbi:hypothetical protein ABZ252_04990 [Streptomyces sp. NPDC006175]|uniref:hypothetical protein n=1 Tax=Streptomyces sp. NPDC006175 TaxID=3154471 RepID=UPI0033B2AEA5
MARDIAELDKDLEKAETDIGTHSADITKLKDSYRSLRTTQSGLSNTFAGISNTVAGITGGLTGVAASLTALTIGVSAIKLDEKGLTVLGATREWKFSQGFISRIQKRIESEHQKAARKTKEENEKLLEDHKEYIEKIKDIDQDVQKIKNAIRRAGSAAQQEQDRLNASPSNRTDRGIDHRSRPLVRGVASDVKVLRSAVTELTAAFA